MLEQLSCIAQLIARSHNVFEASKLAKRIILCPYIFLALRYSLFILSPPAQADQKLTEEERRANRYLETRKGCSSVSQLMDACVEVLVKDHSDVIVAECPKLIAAYQVESECLSLSVVPVCRLHYI